MMHGKPYEDLIVYVENRVGQIVEDNISSRKLKMSMKIVSLVKAALKGEPEEKSFQQTIDNAKNLTEQKRYYISNYGFKNSIDYINCKTDTLIPDESYDKYHLENIISWWKNKASNRFDTLKSEGRLRTELEVWTSNKHIDIIR